jgi:hypothetical protein
VGTASGSSTATGSGGGGGGSGGGGGGTGGGGGGVCVTKRVTKPSGPQSWRQPRAWEAALVRAERSAPPRQQGQWNHRLLTCCLGDGGGGAGGSGAGGSVAAGWWTS